MNIYTFWLENDWVVKILLIAVLFMFVIVLEKLYQFYRSYKNIKQMSQMRTLAEVSELNDGKVRQLLEEVNGFDAKSESLFNANVGVKLEVFEQYMMRYVSILGLIAVLSPMLGLIGTFLGVWHVFQGVGSVGLNDPAMIASGIKEVLIDTMAGLSVAVVAMIFYKSFEFTAIRFVTRFEEKLYVLIRDSREA